MEGFKPFGMPMKDILSVTLLFEEYEAIRLCDYEGLLHDEAAIRMRVSRPTFTRTYDRARKTIALALTEGLAIMIEGGNFRTEENWFRCRHCMHVMTSRRTIEKCDECDSDEIQNMLKENKKMKIALPTRGTMIDDHFGHCENYTVFTINDKDEIESKEIIASESGCGCKSGIAGILQQKGVEVMLAGNMGDGALNVLQHHGIAVYRGCHGDITDVTKAFLNGQLIDSGASCGHNHGDGGHGHECHNH